MTSINDGYKHITFQQRPCERCGYGHFNSVCPAINKVCFNCHKFGHFAKTCQQKQKSKSQKKLQRDQQRIQTFYQNVLLRKELPFAGISNAAFAQCMDLRGSVPTELASVTCKLKKLKESYVNEEHIKGINSKNSKLEETVRDLQLQLRLQEESYKVKEQNFSMNLDNLKLENSKLKENVSDLQNKLTLSVVQKDTMSTFQNEIKNLERERDMHIQCCEALMKKSNEDFLEFAGTKRDLEQQLAMEVSQKDLFKLLFTHEQKSTRKLQDELNELNQCDPSAQQQYFGDPSAKQQYFGDPSAQQQYFVDPSAQQQYLGDQNQQEQTFPYQQQPVYVTPQCEQMQYMGFRPHRGRRRPRRGTFF